MVFEVDSDVWRKGGNPFKVDTPWGRPIVVSIGDLAEKIENMRDVLDDYGRMITLNPNEPNTWELTQKKRTTDQ
jgi:hypothetical protein